jgi:hypothetical protein
MRQQRGNDLGPDRRIQTPSHMCGTRRQGSAAGTGPPSDRQDGAQVYVQKRTLACRLGDCPPARPDEGRKRIGRHGCRSKDRALGLEKITPAQVELSRVIDQADIRVKGNEGFDVGRRRATMQPHEIGRGRLDGRSELRFAQTAGFGAGLKEKARCAVDASREQAGDCSLRLVEKKMLFAVQSAPDAGRAEETAASMLQRAVDDLPLVRGGGGLNPLDLEADTAPFKHGFELLKVVRYLQARLSLRKRDV